MDPMYMPYGAPITLKQAREVAAAAEAEALKNEWPVVIAILDTGGHLVLLHRLDNTQIASVEVAQAKAYSAVGFRRPSKAWEEVVASGPAGARILGLPGALPVEGGIPLVANGQIIGAIGISGVKSNQDGIIAAAGAAALK